MYKIRPRKTKPQGLLFLCFFLMLVVMALNVMLYQVAPQYFMYGSQHYLGVSLYSLYLNQLKGTSGRYKRLENTGTKLEL